MHNLIRIAAGFEQQANTGTRQHLSFYCVSVLGASARLRSKSMGKPRKKQVYFGFFFFNFSRVTRNVMRTIQEYLYLYHSGADILALFDVENVIKMNIAFGAFAFFSTAKSHFFSVFSFHFESAP